jgi:hypothetical protein
VVHFGQHQRQLSSVLSASALSSTLRARFLPLVLLLLCASACLTPATDWRR